MRIDQRVTRIFNFLGKHLFNLQYLSHLLESNSPEVYPCANLASNVENTGGIPC